MITITTSKEVVGTFNLVIDYPDTDEEGIGKITLRNIDMVMVHEAINHNLAYVHFTNKSKNCPICQRLKERGYATDQPIRGLKELP